MKFICYSRCSTCKGIEESMKEKGLTYEKRDIVEDNPQAEELKAWHEASGLPIKRFFNTSGRIYREKSLKDKVDKMPLDQAYELLAQDGLLVKRPILLVDDQVYIGPDVKKYIASL